MADVPNKMIYLDMNWRINQHWQWYFNTKWIKDRARVPTDERDPIPDYHRVNTRLSYNNLLPGLTIALGAKNLFDSDAREPSNGSVFNDYPLRGRQWVLESSYRF